MHFPLLCREIFYFQIAESWGSLPFYQYTHRSVGAGQRLYRLMVIHVNENAEYSKVVMLAGSGQASPSIFPNPTVASQVFVYLPVASQVTVVSQVGAVVWQGMLQKGVQQLPGHRAPAGMNKVKVNSYTLPVLVQ